MQPKAPHLTEPGVSNQSLDRAKRINRGRTVARTRLLIPEKRVGQRPRPISYSVLHEVVQKGQTPKLSGAGPVVRADHALAWFLESALHALGDIAWKKRLSRRLTSSIVLIHGDQDLQPQDQPLSR